MFTKKCFMHNLVKLSNISKRKESNYYSDFMIHKNKGWWNNKQEIKKYNLK